MKINALNSNLNFARALSAREQKEFVQTANEARRELNLKETSATVFDFSVPTKKYDTGIGTTFSDDSLKLVDMLKTMCGVNSIQLGPQGEISDFVHSPYSGTNFSLGSHLIDLKKLKTSSYGNLLTAQDFEAPYFNRVNNKDKVQYANVFAADGQDSILRKAYARFNELDASSPLKQEFEDFKKENTYWLERDALFEAAAYENNDRDTRNWNDRDKNIFATKEGDKERIAQLKKVKDEHGNNIVDYEEFVQFIASKQLFETKANLNKKGIDLYGDSQIGVSQKDVWAHKSAFASYEFGSNLGGDVNSCWSPAFDFDKLDGEAGEFLFNKFDLLFKRYNGARIDAAWQYVKPQVAQPMVNDDGGDVFDENKNKLGVNLKHPPEVKNDGRYIMHNIILKAADKNNLPHDKIYLEMLGGNSYAALDAVKNTGMKLIHITRYANDKGSWGRVKHYETQGSNNKYQNMKPGDYILGTGTHDDPSLIKLSQDKETKNRIKFLSQDLKINPETLHDEKNLANAMTAELFTTSNQFMTLPDILGSDRRINLPNTSDGNWIYRAGSNYEEEYHKNLAQNKGLNYADALSKALKAKNGNPHLINKLNHFADILRANGPMTSKEADKLDLNG